MKDDRITPIGFSRYKVRITKRGLEVFGKYKQLKPVTDAYHNLRKFYLIHDSGKGAFISELRLAYAVNKGVDCTKMDSSVKLFGSVDDIRVGDSSKSHKEKVEDGKKRITQFKITIKAIEKALLKNDYSDILYYGLKHKDDICGKFHTQYKPYISLEQSKCIFDKSQDLVISRAGTCSFRSIRSMDALFMSAMQTTFMNDKKNCCRDVQIDKCRNI